MGDVFVVRKEAGERFLVTEEGFSPNMLKEKRVSAHVRNRIERGGEGERVYSSLFITLFLSSSLLWSIFSDLSHKKKGRSSCFGVCSNLYFFIGH
jgi:hypothetical protein